MRIDLPNDYIAYLEGMGVAEGFTEGLPGYFALGSPTRPRQVTEISRSRRTRPASWASAQTGAESCSRLTDPAQSSCCR